MKHHPTDQLTTINVWAVEVDRLSWLTQLYCGMLP